MPRNKPLWQSELERLMECGELRIVLHWIDNSQTEKIIQPDGDINFVGECIQEHEDPPPHTGILKLKEITAQVLVGPVNKEKWGKMLRIWPDNRLAQTPKSF